MILIVLSSNHMSVTGNHLKWIPKKIQSKLLTYCKLCCSSHLCAVSSANDKLIVVYCCHMYLACDLEIVIFHLFKNAPS